MSHNRLLDHTVKNNLDGNLFWKIKSFRNNTYISLERNFHLISLQRNACKFVWKSRVNLALAKYTYNFEIIKSFKPNCRQVIFNSAGYSNVK